MNTKFGIGNVLASGFWIWIKNFVPFMIITALIYAPVLIWGISTVQGEMTIERLGQIDTFDRYSGFLVLVLDILASAALTYGVVMELQGQRASLGACITTGLKRFFPALGTMLLMIVCIGLVALATMIPLAMILSGVGVLVSSVAILWIVSMLWIATQASVIERPGVMGALGRSRDLTNGHKFAISVLLIILGLLSWVLAKFCQTFALPHLGDPEFAEETIRNLPKYVYMSLAEQMIMGSISAVMASVAYYFLRAEKEGTSASELAAVFD